MCAMWRADCGDARCTHVNFMSPLTGCDTSQSTPSLFGVFYQPRLNILVQHPDVTPRCNIDALTFPPQRAGHLAPPVAALLRSPCRLLLVIVLVVGQSDARASRAVAAPGRHAPRAEVPTSALRLAGAAARTCGPGGARSSLGHLRDTRAAAAWRSKQPQLRGGESRLVRTPRPCTRNTRRRGGARAEPSARPLAWRRITQQL